MSIAGDREREQDDALAELGRFIVGDAALDAAMLRIAATAKALLEPVAEASITFAGSGTSAWTVASTGELASQLDEVQYGLGRGPCIDAATAGVVVRIDDLAEDARWADYGDRAVRAGARSSVSVPFPLQEHVLAALNLYAAEPAAFDDEHVELAEEIAARAAVAVVNAVRYESAAEAAEQLRRAMESRAVIEQAKGILMGRSNCSADEAFDMLVRASQRSNRKLRDIAQEIVDRRSFPAVD